MAIKITITGENKSGKSTIANYLKVFLSNLGMKVILEDEELTPEWHMSNNRRLNLLGELETPVKIVTTYK